MQTDVRRLLKTKSPTEDCTPLHAARIEDYALIGDCETAALICRNGSLDWLCWPTFASGACFASLLGTSENGYFQIRPAEDERVTDDEWRYKPHTLIVEKVWKTENGEVLVSDFMPPRGNNSDVVRIVKGLRGTVNMRMDMVLRFDYGRTIPWVERVDHHMRAIAGPELVV
ncbi:MAG: trehalase-like domain-containing protein, partial [Terriglobus sp.]